MTIGEWTQRSRMKPMTLGLHLRRLLFLTRAPDGKQGHKMTEVRFQWQETAVLLIVKKDSPKGPQVAFFRSATFEGALEMLAAAVSSKTVQWKPDKYAKKS